MSPCEPRQSPRTFAMASMKSESLNDLLAEEGDAAKPVGLLPYLLVIESGEEDNRDVPRGERVLHLVDGREPTSSRHPHIQDYEIGLVLTSRLESLLAVVSVDNPLARRAKPYGEGRYQVPVIIGDKYQLPFFFQSLLRPLSPRYRDVGLLLYAGNAI